METEKLLLNTTRLAEAFSRMEKGLTDSAEQLAVLQVKGELLKNSWQGAAYDAWQQELEKRLLRAEAWIKGTRLLLFKVQDAAVKLVEVEERNVQLAESNGWFL